MEFKIGDKVKLDEEEFLKIYRAESYAEIALKRHLNSGNKPLKVVEIEEGFRWGDEIFNRVGVIDENHEFSSSIMLPASCVKKSTKTFIKKL